MSYHPKYELLVVEIKDRIATICFNRPEIYNALSAQDYIEIADTIRWLDTRDDVSVVILTGNGKYFSSGANIKVDRQPGPNDDVRTHFRGHLELANGNLTRSLIDMKKVLVVALNGPVIGLAAAIVGFADIIYSVDDAFLMTPFSSLGLVAEGATSYMFVKRMGLAKASEALLFDKKMTAKELKECGFINHLWPNTPDFIAKVRAEIETTIKDLNPRSLVGTKQLVWAAFRDDVHLTNLKELDMAIDRFASGDPAKEFMRLANKSKKHNL